MILIFPIHFTWNIAGSLMFYFLDLKNSSFKLAIIYSNIVDYIFVNKNETFIFFFPDPPQNLGLIEYSYMTLTIVI